MATFSRKALKAMGIEDEKIDSIIEMHTDVVETLKSERDTYKEKADKFDGVQKQLDTANEKLAKYSENGETVSKEDYDKLKGEYDTYKADIAVKETRTAKEKALRLLLKGVGISENGIELALELESLKPDNFELDKDGKLKEADKIAEMAKTKLASYVETTTTKGANTATPPANRGNGGTKTKAEIMAIKDDAERQAAIYENKALFGF